jgi:hypothetical protein
MNISRVLIAVGLISVFAYGATVKADDFDSLKSNIHEEKVLKFTKLNQGYEELNADHQVIAITGNEQHALKRNKAQQERIVQARANIVCRLAKYSFAESYDVSWPSRGAFYLPTPNGLQAQSSVNQDFHAGDLIPLVGFGDKLGLVFVAVKCAK